MLEPSQHRELTESYKQLYLGEVDDISSIMIEEIVEELIDECLEFGHDIDNVLEAVEIASYEYFDNLDLEESSTNAYFAAMHKAQNVKRQGERKQAKAEKRKEAVRQAVGKVKSKLAGAAVSAYSAGKSAKEGAKKAASAAGEGVRKAGEAGAAAAQKKKAEVKGGVKKLLGKGLRAVAGGAGRVAQAARKAGSAAGRAAERLGEEVLDEKIATGTGKRVMPSAAERSRLATRARAGEDIGKAGKGFKKVAAKAAKQYGSKEAGERVAAAAMFKAQAHEEVDIYDVVLEFLQAEGYVETLEEAEWMMVNLIDEEAIDIILGEEQLDEISQKTATRAFARRATDEFESDGDNPRDFTKSGKSKADETKRRIEKKFGKKAGAHAERAAHRGIYGRKGAGGMPSVKEEHEEYLDEADSLAAMQARREKRQKANIKKHGTPGFDYSKPHSGKKGYIDTITKKEEFESWLDEAMSNYEKNRKRAAQRAAARNAARDQGKTGAVPGVGYVTPRRERATYTDERGVERHHSGARMK